MRLIDADALLHEMKYRLIGDLEAVIELVEEQPTANELISVNDMLPDIGETVLCFDGFNFWVGWKMPGEWWSDGESDDLYVTHWMPILRPPKEEK